MTDSTTLNADELKSELRRLLAIHTLATEQAKRLGLDVPEEIILGGFIKAIEAYRKKQVGEVLDRLESTAAYGTDIEEYAEDVLSAIEVERNKLKERTNDQL